MSVGETLYKILIRAYPERFRAHHEEDLLQWFRQHRAAVRRQGGLLAGLRFWTLILRDLLASVPTQHVYAAGQGRKRRRRRNDQQQSDPIEIRHSDGALHSGRTRRSNRRHTSRHGSEIMDTLHQDTRLALRSFRRAPAFFVLAVTTLAVGVGFATTLFSVVQGVLLAPLPYAESERLVRVGAGLDRTSGKIYALSAPEAFDLQARNRSFEALAISRSLRVTVRGDGAPELFSGAMISAQFFDVFRVQPAHGRAFTPAEDEPGAPRVAVLGHDLWQRRWGGDSGILGQTVTLGRTAFEVVGIMPEDFRPPEALGQRNAEVWIPLALLDEATRNDRINHFLYGVGRLRPGVSLATAQADLTALSARAAEEYPELDEPGFGLVSLHRETVGRIDQTLLPLFGAVGLLLLIACTNVANLLLIRASARGREMALRTAIGASRNRIVRQLLTESLVLGLLGGGFGVAIALAGVRSFVALSPSNIPRLTEVGVDANVLAFAVLVSVLTSLLFGWIPALRSSRPDLSRGLKEGARGTGGSARQERLRNVLVIAETAVAFVLVVGAGLLIHSFMRLQQVDKGFDPEQVQVLSVTSPPAESSAELPGFYGTVTDRIAALPGVTAVGITANLPLSGNYAMRGIEAVDDRPDYRHENGVYYQHVTAGFFEAMGIPLRRGRLFDPADQPGSQPVAIVNTTMARDLFGADNPLGRRFKAFDGYEATWFEVIGVVGDVRTLDLARAGMPEMYLAFDQDPHGRPMDIVARTAGDERSTLPAMRALWHSLHPDVPVRRSVHMEELVASSIAAPRFNTLVLGAFAGVALILALVGIYGALAYSVAQRAHELGVRMALGATGGSVLGMILRRGMTLVLIGVALGLGGALLATRVLESLIFGISPTDGVTLALGVATVVVAALVASSIPAWRATRLDPLTILRSE